MDSDIMADGDIAADMRGTRIVRHMDTGAVLHVGTVADGDRCHVATNDGVEPHRTFVAHRHIAHDGGVLTEITFLAPLRAHTSITFDECHNVGR